MTMRMGAGLRSRRLAPALGLLILGVGSCRGGGEKLVGRSDVDGSFAGPGCNQNASCSTYGCGARCEEGHCVGGVVCTNPDVDHCIVSCESSPEAGGDACIVKARDIDGDGHGDARCEAAAGDDCNDTEPTVFAGAEEKCDGLDNDCDGRIDSFDSLPLGGSVLNLARETKTGSMGVIATPYGYAVERLVQTYSGGAGNPAIIHLLDSSGVITWNLFLEQPSWYVNNPDLSIDGSQLVFPALMGTVVGGQIVSAINDTLISQVGLPDGTSYVSTTNALGGGWMFGSVTVQAATPAGVYYAPVSSDGTLGQTLELAPLSGQGSLMDMATGTTNYGAIWLDYSGSSSPRVATVRWAVFTPSSATILPDLDSVATDVVAKPLPQIAATNDGFATGWFDSEQKLEFARFKADGTPLCGPIPIDGAASWGFENSMISDGSGILATIVDAKGKASLVQIDDHCTASVVQPALNAPGTLIAGGTPSAYFPVPVGQPAITRSSDGHIACTWVEQDALADGGTSTQYRYMIRIMSSRLCDSA